MHRDLLGQKYPRVTVATMDKLVGRGAANEQKQHTKQRKSIMRVVTEGQREAKTRAESSALLRVRRPMTEAIVGTNTDQRPSGTMQSRWDGGSRRRSTPQRGCRKAGSNGSAPRPPL
jgi:hypothetical protein